MSLWIGTLWNVSPGFINISLLWCLAFVEHSNTLSKMASSVHSHAASRKHIHRHLPLLSALSFTSYLLSTLAALPKGHHVHWSSTHYTGAPGSNPNPNPVPPASLWEFLGKQSLCMETFFLGCEFSGKQPRRKQSERFSIPFIQLVIRLYYWVKSGPLCLFP